MTELEARLKLAQDRISNLIQQYHSKRCTDDQRERIYSHIRQVRDICDQLQVKIMFDNNMAYYDFDQMVQSWQQEDRATGRSDIYKRAKTEMHDMEYHVFSTYIRKKHVVRAEVVYFRDHHQPRLARSADKELAYFDQWVKKLKVAVNKIRTAMKQEDIYHIYKYMWYMMRLASLSDLYRTKNQPKNG